ARRSKGGSCASAGRARRERSSRRKSLPGLPGRWSYGSLSALWPPSPRWAAESSFLCQPLDDLARGEERFLFLPVQLGNGLRQPRMFCLLHAVPHGGTLGSHADVHLAAIGGMRLSFHQAAFFERGNGGPHGLRFHAFGACQVGRGGRSVPCKA